MTRILLLASIFTIAGSVPYNAAGLDASHTGARNPISEGWTLIDESDGGHRFGPVRFQPPYGPKGAWRIDTDTNGESGVGAYQQFFPAVQVPTELVVTLRTDDIDALGGQAMHLGTGIPLPGGEFLHVSMRFGVSDDGDPLVAVGQTGVPIEVNGGANLFHMYSMEVDTRFTPPRTWFAIDGVRMGSAEIYGDPSSDIMFEWGDLNSDPAINGSALWYFVGLTGGIPEPSGFLLAILGVAGLTCKRGKRR